MKSWKSVSWAEGNTDMWYKFNATYFPLNFSVFLYFL